jgi:biotin carboxylase
MGMPGVKRLAFVYHPRSFATMAISRAAEGVCDLIWVIDRERGETAMMERLLRRIGEVVDVTGLSPRAAADRVAAARPDGILALHDSLLPWTADVAEHLGLPFHSPATARRLSDKRAQREALAAAGIAVPRCLPVPPAGDRVALQALLGAATFPAVLKPRVSDSSRNTLLVRDRRELRAALDDVARHAPADRGALQLEEYLRDRPGAPTGDAFAEYVSVESVVLGGAVTHLAVTGRFPLAPPFRETGLFIPAALPDDERAAVLDLAADAAVALGARRGVLHTEIKLTPDGPRVIEVNGRIGGDVPEMLRAAAGLELMPIALCAALGTQEAVAPLPRTRGVAFTLLRQLAQEHDRLAAVDGLDGLRALPGVHQVTLNRGPGSGVDWRAGTDEAIFTVHGLAADHDALLEIRRAAEHDVLVTGTTAQAADAANAADSDEDERPPLRFRAIGALNAVSVLSSLPLVA